MSIQAGCFPSCGAAGRVPIPGMTVVPDFFGTDEWEILLGGFWASLCNFAIGEPAAREAFKADTGLDVESILPRSPLDAMIDEATGFKAQMLARWCDWVTLTHWNDEANNQAHRAMQKEATPPIL